MHLDELCIKMVTFQIEYSIYNLKIINQEFASNSSNQIVEIQAHNMDKSMKVSNMHAPNFAKKHGSHNNYYTFSKRKSMI